MHRKALAPVLLTLALVFGPSPARAETIVGLTTSNQIFFFDSATPGSIGPLVTVTGLLPGTSLVGIDFRPAVPGQLTGVGQTGASGAVYRIDPLTGVATQVNTIQTLTGTQFGVDFNPVPDALRIVSDADQNLRITVGGAGVVNTDGTLNPGDPNVVGAAYSNNVPGGVNGQTTLYDIDSVLDRLFTQGGVNFPPGTPPVSPNTGTLFPVGSLGVDTNDLVGFDISGFTRDGLRVVDDPAGPRPVHDQPDHRSRHFRRRDRRQHPPAPGHRHRERAGARDPGPLRDRGGWPVRRGPKTAKLGARGLTRCTLTAPAGSLGPGRSAVLARTGFGKG